MVNSERRISLMRAAVAPPGEARADWQIFAGVAARMGFHGFDWADAAAVYDEFAALTAGRPCDQSGVSHARLENGSLQWPVRSFDHPGTERLYTDGRYFTETGEPVLKPALPGPRRRPARRGLPADPQHRPDRLAVAHDDPHRQVGGAARERARAVPRGPSGGRTPRTG